MSTIYAGLGIGAIYALVALGYNVVFLSSRVFNFAQAQFVTVGAFLGAVSSGSHGVPVGWMIPIGAVGGGILGLAQERLTVRPLRRGPAASGDGHSDLIVTVGVAIFLEGVVLVVWGADPRGVPFFTDNRPKEILGGTALPVELTLLAVAVVLAVVLGWYLRSTAHGLAALACAENPEAAQLRGIDVRRVALAAFAIAGAIGMAVGPLVGAKTLAVYSLGTALALKSFVALALGGFGSQAGAVVGGLTVGVVEAATVRWVGIEYGLLAVFLLLVVVLMARPAGIFGGIAGRPA